MIYDGLYFQNEPYSHHMENMIIRKHMYKIVFNKIVVSHLFTIVIFTIQSPYGNCDCHKPHGMQMVT